MKLGGSLHVMRIGYCGFGNKAQSVYIIEFIIIKMRPDKRETPLGPFVVTVVDSHLKIGQSCITDCRFCWGVSLIYGLCMMDRGG